MSTHLEDLCLIAKRDNLTVDSVRVLIEMWAFPIGLAIRPAYEKALANHRDWQAFRDANRATVPSLTEWQAKIRGC